MTDTGIPAVDAALRDGKTSTDRFGNTVRSTFLCEADRYLFDFNLDRERWLQVDTEHDAWYFGVWACPSARSTLSYVEGDVYLVKCADDAAYDRQVAELCASNPPAPAFVVLDTEAATCTEVYEDRRRLFLDPDRGEALVAELRQAED